MDIYRATIRMVSNANHPDCRTTARVTRAEFGAIQSVPLGIRVVAG